MGSGSVSGSPPQPPCPSLIKGLLGLPISCQGHLPQKPLDLPSWSRQRAEYVKCSATPALVGTQIWEKLSDCPGSPKPHPSLRPRGHCSLMSPSLAAQELISGCPPPTTCAQIPGTLSIKDACSEQISFTLIRTRKIWVGGQQRRVVAAHVLHRSLVEPEGLGLGLLVLEARPRHASAGMPGPRGAGSVHPALGDPFLRVEAEPSRFWGPQAWGGGSRVNLALGSPSVSGKSAVWDGIRHQLMGMTRAGALGFHEP